MEENFVQESRSTLDAKRRTFEERGKVINLFIGMSFATIGFIITQITKEDFRFHGLGEKLFLLVGGCLMFLCIALLIGLVLSRLKGVSKEHERLAIWDLAGDRDYDEDFLVKIITFEALSTLLFKAALWIFSFAELFVIIGFCFHIKDKF